MTLSVQGGAAVITGAARGIGAALALELAQRGCHLALADIDIDDLAVTAQKARAFGVRVSAHQLNVADAHAVAQFPEAVLREHDQVNILINNAGVALIGTFEEIGLADFEWLLGVNFWGVVRMTKAFLPLLRAAPAAQIVNLSSLFGLIAPAGQTAYSASKFAVRGFSEALRHELDDSTVGVTCVHPGGVRTAIAERARSAPNIGAKQLVSRRAAFLRVARTSPEAAAQLIVAGLEERRARVLVGGDAVLFDWLQRLMPLRYFSLMQRVLGRRAQRRPVEGST
jgi:short-subunit dehydrogenase